MLVCPGERSRVAEHDANESRCSMRRCDPSISEPWRDRASSMVPPGAARWSLTRIVNRGALSLPFLSFSLSPPEKRVGRLVPRSGMQHGFLRLI
jgi:hypothetical protein